MFNGKTTLAKFLCSKNNNTLYINFDFLLHKKIQQIEDKPNYNDTQKEYIKHITILIDEIKNIIDTNNKKVFIIDGWFSWGVYWENFNFDEEKYLEDLKKDYNLIIYYCFQFKDTNKERWLKLGKGRYQCYLLENYEDWFSILIKRKQKIENVLKDNLKYIVCIDTTNTFRIFKKTAFGKLFNKDNVV